MPKKMLIDATHAEETRVVVVDGNKVEEFDFESVNKRQLAGNIYLAKVTRVEPSLQAAFIDYGGNRHGFLAFSEIHPDYYQIPVADREALLAEERAEAEAAEEEERKPARRRSRSRSKAKAEAVEDADAQVETAEPAAEAAAEGEKDAEASEAPAETAEAPAGDEPAPISGMDVIDLDDDKPGDDEDGDAPFRAVDHAAEMDEEIESVADEDVTEEIRRPRKPRVRRYKIQEVIKVRQIMLVQVVKEERGNKGAALTTYLSLAGRYCVLMPNTARGGGISRKITNAADRKKLKEIANEMTLPEGAGLIIRTAGAQRTKAEVRRDYEYLMRLWEQIRELTLKSIAPAPIYEEGNLIKRTIRDLYSREIDEVWVEGEGGYRTAKDFMRMIMPSHAKNVKLYQEAMPLFARYQVESYLSSMFNPTVQLKSGGYIVIGITEALVAIDINSGRATKEGSIEETATKTNLEAAEEIARQLRLRDLAGLIVIDFIDMEDRKNNAAVEKKLKDKLKTDRARIQVGRISGFGLLEMSRQRLRPGMLEATTQPCPHCHGTGLIRSDDNLALAVLRQLEEEGTRKRSKEVLLKAPVAIVNYLMNEKREHVAQIEARYGMAVRLEADPMLISPDFSIEKFKTATRVVAPAAPVVSIDTTEMDALDDAAAAAAAAEDEQEEVAEADRADDNGEGQGGKKKRRRRRRRRGGGGGEANGDAVVASEAAESDGTPVEAPAQAEAGSEAEDETKAPRKRSRSRGGRGRGKASEAEADEAIAAPDKAAEDAAEAPEVTQAAEAEAEEAPKKRVTRSRRKTPAKEAAEAEPAKTEPAEETAPAEAQAAEAETADAPKPKRVRKSRAKPKEPVAAEATEAPVLLTQPIEPAAPKPAAAKKAEPAAEPEAKDDKPKRKGWWSLGR